MSVDSERCPCQQFDELVTAGAALLVEAQVGISIGKFTEFQ